MLITTAAQAAQKRACPDAAARAAPEREANKHTSQVSVSGIGRSTDLHVCRMGSAVGALVAIRQSDSRPSATCNASEWLVLNSISTGLTV